MQLSPLPPPEGILQEITPWRRAMRYVLIGFALQYLTISLFWLDHILPAIGITLMLLGFRSLKTDSRWFYAAWLITWGAVLVMLITLIQNATIWHPLTVPLEYATAILNIALGIALWGGLRHAQRRAGLSGRWSSADALLLLMVVPTIMTLLRLPIVLIPLLLLLAFPIVLYCLHRLVQRLDIVGYTLRPTTVRIANHWIVGMLLLTLVIGLTIGYSKFNQYPMDWQETTATNSAEAQAGRERLLALGAPLQVVSDLNEQDLTVCQNATAIAMEENDRPVNSSFDRVWSAHDATIGHTIPQLHVTSLAIQLSDRPGHHLIIHHFHWRVSDGFPGTDAMLLTPAYSAYNDLWTAGSQRSGQVLYDQNHHTYAAPFYHLDEIDPPVYQNAPAHQRIHDLFATFSFPKNGTQCRGYIAYDILPKNADTAPCNASTLWFHLIHQHSAFQYPVQTVVEDYIAGKHSMWHSSDVFVQMSYEEHLCPAPQSVALEP